MTKKKGPTEPTNAGDGGTVFQEESVQTDVQDGVEVRLDERTGGAEEIPEMSPIMTRGNQTLEEAKGKFSVVVVVGLLENGLIDITSNLPQYPTMQWMLDRAKFELHIHEKNSFNTGVPE